MALFNRKQTNKTVLPEIERYYEAEKRDRPGMAWLLAAVTVLGVVAVIIGLFFGGRWAYRAITDNDKTHVTVKAPTKSDNKSDNSKTQESENTSTNSSQPTNNTPSQATSSTSTTTPSTSTNSNLANTGPESVIPAFVLATLLGILFYRIKLAKN